MSEYVYIINILNKYVSNAFRKAGYEKEYGNVVISNRLDLCQFQYKGTLACSKSMLLNQVLLI